MQSRLFGQSFIAAQEPSDCWAEFSIDKDSSDKIADLYNSLNEELEMQSNVALKPAHGHHVSLLYGYRKSESEKLMEIIKKHFDRPLTLIGDEIRLGDISPVILLGVQIPQELENLFWESYENVGEKKHSLINGKYDPHITIASFDKADKGKIDLEKLKDSLKGKTFNIDTIFSFSEDKDGNNILLHDYSHASQQLSFTK